MNSIWNIEELSSRKVQLKIVKGEQFKNLYGKTSAVYFNGVPHNGEQTEIFAYYGVPNAPMPNGGYPGIVLVHGGGGMAFCEWVEYWCSKGYVAIAFDHSSRQYGSLYLEGKDCCLPNKKGGACGWNPFTATVENYKDQWIYQAVSNTILCYNALRDTGCVNAEKIALTGVSWGSVVGALVMGIDQRFSCFAPLYGGGYLTLTSLFEKGEIPSDFDAEKWYKHFDPSSYIGNNHKPIHFTMGLLDPAFSPVSNAKTYNLSKGEVTYSQRKNLDHGHIFMEHRGTINVFRFIDKVINNNPMPFEVIESKMENGYLFAKIDNVKNAKQARFNYTFNSLEGSQKSADWVWESFEIPIADMKVEIPKGTTACMIEITDGNKPEYVQSTKVYFPN